MPFSRRLRRRACGAGEGPGLAALCGVSECRQFMRAAELPSRRSSSAFSRLHYAVRGQCGAPRSRRTTRSSSDGWASGTRRSTCRPSSSSGRRHAAGSNPTSRSRDQRWSGRPNGSSRARPAVASVTVDGVAADDARRLRRALRPASADAVPVLDVPPVKFRVRGLPEAWVERVARDPVLPGRTGHAARSRVGAGVAGELRTVIEGRPARSSAGENAGRRRSWPSPLGSRCPPGCVLLRRRRCGACSGYAAARRRSRARGT